MANIYYSFNGRYLGWMQNGWFYDRQGRPSLFSNGASGGPSKPSRASAPSRA
ncbi:4-fold beta flower protein [Pedobacter sp. ISL-64]|uniref:4-fold beta flower protein n=1 Tax=unclassified Pedobacter TaxID=2628915 RepID=UPI00397BB69F